MAQGSSGKNILWLLFVGGCVIYRAFGLGEPETAVFEQVTVAYDNDSDQQLAENIAKSLATDLRLGTGKNKIWVELSGVGSGYELQASLKQGVTFVPSEFQYMARLLTDECSPNAPIRLRIMDNKDKFLGVVEPCPPLGTELSRKSDTLYYKGDIDEEEAASIFDTFQEIQFLDDTGTTLQAERNGDQLVIRLPFAAPTNDQEYQKLKQLQLGNLSVIAPHLAGQNARLETTNDAFVAISGLGWDLAVVRNFCVAFDDSIDRATAEAIAERSASSNDNFYSLAVNKGTSGVECFTTSLANTDFHWVGYWGSEILSSMPEDINQVTMRMETADEEIVERTVTTRAGRKVKSEGNILFVAAPESDDTFAESLLQTLRDLEYFEEDSGRIFRMAKEDEQYVVQFIMPEEDARDVDQESLAGLGQVIRDRAFADRPFRFELAATDFESIEGKSWTTQDESVNVSLRP